jgi:ADP-ribosyl-[dinitrogen reductase] hydrolase
VNAPDPTRFEGCLLGLMVGDCLGLPREGLSARRARRIFGQELRHALVARRGLASDDTEHACMTAQAYLATRGDPERFARSLAWRLRLWLLGLPAGIGFATLRALFKLWLGIPPSRSGVYSAGNGPAMRAPILGLVCWNDRATLEALVRASTRLTHTDPKAERGALAVALAARYAATHEAATFRREDVLTELEAVFPPEDSEARTWLAALRKAVLDPADEDRFAEETGLGKGVSGYVYHTVPAVLWAWLRSPFDFEGGLRRVIDLGGDTDTTAAIYGGIAGAAVGSVGVPQRWLDGIVEFPRSVGWVRRLARSLAAGGDPVPLAWPLLPVRNLAMLVVVILHGFRRTLPPY